MPQGNINSETQHITTNFRVQANRSSCFHSKINRVFSISDFFCVGNGTNPVNTGYKKPVKYYCE